MTPASNTLRAVALIMSAMAIIPSVDVFAKFLGQEGLPLLQLVWARFFFGTLFTLPFALRIQGAAALTPSRPYLQAARALILVSGTACFFAGLKFLPIADTLAIYFVYPILITALSPLVLGERVGPRQWVTVCVGFIGVLIIIRPGLLRFNVGMLFALGAGFCSACYLMLTRFLTGSVNAMVTTFQTSLIGAVALSIALPFVWVGTTVTQWLMLVGIGLFAIVSHFAIAKAYDYGEASLLSPLGYTEMVTAVFFGWYFFGDFPDRYTFLGVTILIACAIYISIRERSQQHPV
jgi:drug/metabolite transporter (DMT)-like permease